jgi:protein-L-isoaspartate(D-aspartate) O-methyltransferase
VAASEPVASLVVMEASRLRAYADSVSAPACLFGVGVVSERVGLALATVPRHRLVERFYFVPFEEFLTGAELKEYEVDPASVDDAVLDIVYSDEALITRLDGEGRPTSSTSQPSLVAGMLELLDLRPGMRVLEIGAGTGYNAALMAELVNDPGLVTTIDIQPDVVAATRRLLDASGYGDIRVLCRDGAEGASEQGPFDRIVATVGCPDISWRWVEQLDPGGMMLIPLQHGGPSADPLVRLRPTDSGHLEGRVVAWSGFMPIQGNLAAFLWPEVTPDGTGEADAQFELLPALADAPLTMNSFRAGKRAWWDFAYFLALEDNRTHFGRMLALADPSGDRIVLDNEAIRLWGDPSLYQDLVAAYHHWERLGRPELSEWHVRLVPRTEPEPRHDPQRSWVVPRPTTWQIVQLRSPLH